MNTFHRILTLFALLLLFVPVASADWSENFDSYTPGSGLAGQGGWDGWQGSTTVDAFVTDSISRSPSNSVAIRPTTDIVHTFSERNGEWEMTAWSYIPSTATDSTFFIMLNSYFPATNYWSIQLEFNNSTGMLTCENGDFTQTAIIYDQWVEVKIEIDLESNECWKYYNGVEVEYWAWYGAPGEKSIAALDLFSSGGSTIYWDDLNLANVGALEQTTWGSIKSSIQ